jgi:2-polyprenyl-6-methoxyphenol hydroxylase-like FAD-dependent oxidoreductase
MAGLFSGLLLHRIGWDVHIFERVDAELASRGAGIVTHRELIGALGRAGIDRSDEVGIEVPGRRTLDRDGKIIGQLSLRQTMTSWGRIFGLLIPVLPEDRYHKGKNLQSVTQTASGVAASFEDGTTESGNLLIGADGIHSTVRQQLAPEISPIYAGYIAWRGLVDEAKLSPEAHDALFNWLGFCLPPGEQMLGYPVAGPENDLRPGHRHYNFVWYRPADEMSELARLLTDSDGRRNELSIAPDRIHPDVVAEMRAAADSLLAPQFSEVVGLTEQPFFQPIYDLKVPRMAFGHVALLGDAAFVGRPHVGMGVTKAAGDAVALADALLETEHDVEQALKLFENARLPIGAAVIARARHLGAYMQAQISTDEERRMAETFRTPEAVMKETAVADFLAHLDG